MNSAVLNLHPSSNPRPSVHWLVIQRGWKGWGSGGEVVENCLQNPEKKNSFSFLVVDKSRFVYYKLPPKWAFLK